MPAHRTSPQLERGTATILLAAFLAALAGAALLIGLAAEGRLRSAPAGETVRVGQLSLSVEEAAWIGHDMSSMGPMPMDGTPAPGKARLRARVLVGNRSAEPARLNAEAFTVVAPSGASWPAASSTMPAARDLASAAQIMGDLYFEVPAGESDFQLRLATGGERGQVALSLPGSADRGTHHDERSAP